MQSISYDLQAAWERDPLSLCGEMLGNGCSRTGYVCALSDELVIKVQHSADGADGLFSENASEMLFCQHASEEMLRWVARAIWISHDGKYLAMERAEIPAPLQLFRSVPLIFAGDSIASNWGMLNGRFVTTDYPQALWNAVNGALKIGLVPTSFYDPEPFRQLEAQCRALAEREPFADDPAMVRFHLKEAEQHALQARFMEQSMIEAKRAESTDLQSGRELIAPAQGRSNHPKACDHHRPE